MALFTCPHCDELIEFLGSDRREPQCECGAIMELVAASDDADHRDAFFGDAITIPIGSS